MNKTIWVLNMTAGKPDSGWGERHYYFSKQWINKGYEVKIISGSYNHLFHNQPHTLKGKNFTYEYVEDGLTFCWVKIPKYDGGSVFKLWSMIVFAFKTLFLSTKKLGRPSILIVSSMPIFPIITGWILKKRLRIPKLFFEIRDLWPLTPMYLKGYSKYHPIVIVMSFIEKFGYIRSDYIISLLPNAHSYINKISKDPSKLHWIPNGIDINLLDDEPLPNTILNSIPKNKFIVGYTGTMGLANALEYLAEAAYILKENPHIYFLFVGDGYLKNQLKEQLQHCPNVIFIDKINKNQVQNILQLMDVCFIGRNNTPLFDYGVSSNKFFDYMLAKKPIISSSNKIKDPVELSGCGYVVTPEDPKAIVEAIIKLSNMTEESRLVLGTKGYEFVCKYHNFTYLSDLYINLFN